MRPTPNPIHKSGTRNVFCPYYDECLDHAIKHRWKYWKCSECPHKLTQLSLGHVRTIHDWSPFYEYPLRSSEIV